MQVRKITDNTYTFYQEGDNYVLNLGTIRAGEDTTTELLFENVAKLVVNNTCGCTITEENKIDKHTVSVKVKYRNCDSTFSKVLACSNSNKEFTIKIKGICL
jgi:hypothetical protein